MEVFRFEKRCGICGTSKARLVRDHNHKTKQLRGILCEYCNSRLGSYEKVKLMGWNFKKPSMVFWVKRYGNEIETYLSKPETGIGGSGYISWFRYDIDYLCSQSVLAHSEGKPKMENVNDEEVHGLMDYDAEERVQGEKIPNGLVLTGEQLRGLRYKKFMRDFNDGKGPKPRYQLFIGDKTYYVPPIVMDLFRKAVAESGVVKVRLNITGAALNTRYDLDKILDKGAF